MSANDGFDKGGLGVTWSNLGDMRQCGMDGRGRGVPQGHVHLAMYTPGVPTQGYPPTRPYRSLSVIIGQSSDQRQLVPNNQYDNSPFSAELTLFHGVRSGHSCRFCTSPAGLMRLFCR